jgi:hypothetical protein
MATPAEIAQFMLTTYRQQSNYLRQSHVAHLIRQKFGEQFVYKNKNHNWAINAEILDEFRKITPDDTVWSRSRQLWRQRRDYDPPSTRMVR